MGGLRPSRVLTNLLMADLVTLQDYKDAEGIQNPKEDNTKQLVKAASQGWLKTLGDNFLNKEN